MEGQRQGPSKDLKKGKQGVPGQTPDHRQTEGMEVWA